MKKKFYLSIIISMIVALSVAAQESVFEKDDNVVNAGIGFGSSLYGGWYTGYSGYNRLPTITLSYERCIIDNLFNEQSAIGIGAIGGFNYSSHSTWTSTSILIGVRAAFHYAFIDNLDTYAGAMTGYNIHSWKWKGESSSHIHGSSGLAYGVFAGARYYFADPLAVFAEVGHGYTFLNAGIALKF